jgi:ferrous iron transport protein B
MSDGCDRCGEESSGLETLTSPGVTGIRRVALLGNPNTGKTTLFNRLCGLRHKTSNFPGTTQDARIGTVRAEGSAGLHVIDLPGTYSLDIEQNESELCRRVLAGTLAPRGEQAGEPDAVCVVVDATNLARNLLLVGEVLSRRLPTVVALNMIDLARRGGFMIEPAELERQLGCKVVECCARSGEGMDLLVAALLHAVVPSRTPPGTREGLEAWADDVYALCVGHRHAATSDAGGSAAASAVTAGGAAGSAAPTARSAPRQRFGQLTDRLDRVFTHPILGMVAFLLVMAGLLYVVFQIATYPMDWISAIFDGSDDWVAAWQPAWLQELFGSGLSGFVRHVMPEGILADLLSQGVVSGIGATVIFVPQIALMFFLISLLEDTGYLARAAFLMDRVLGPFGLPGHSFIPLLSSHACALPGIMAARVIPDRRQRLLTIMVAPFMTCSARLPVYVLVTMLLFRDQPGLAALAFIGSYALGVLAGLFSALILGKTVLRGRPRPMILELPTYKLPSVRTALITTWDRSIVFLKNAGTNILAISIVLWWLGSYPKVDPPEAATNLRMMAAEMREGRLADSNIHDSTRGTPSTESQAAPFSDREARAAELEAQADHMEASDAKARSFAGQLGRFMQPVFGPLGYDWQLTVGVVTSFAAREVFVSTMAVIVTGEEDSEADGILEQIGAAKRDDGTPVFTIATCWSLLVYYVLAMQCLPTLAVTARESGGLKWAMLQLGWMSVVAYVAALVVYQGLRMAGIS